MKLNCAVFLFSRLIVKQLNRHEVKLLLSQGSAFFRYLVKVFVEKQPSTLTPLYGLFQVSSPRDRKYFVVMQNLRHSQLPPRGRVLLFDLKGLGSHRYVRVAQHEEDKNAIHNSQSPDLTCLSDDLLPETEDAFVKKRKNTAPVETEMNDVASRESSALAMGAGKRFVLTVVLSF